MRVIRDRISRPRQAPEELILHPRAGRQPDREAGGKGVKGVMGPELEKAEPVQLVQQVGNRW